MGNRLFSLIGKGLLAFTLISFISIFVPNASFVEEVKAADLVEYVKLDSSERCLATAEGANKLSCREGEVSTQTAFWLFLLVLVGFVALSNKKKL